eukprot:8489-Heterococcus_DN1.PRE.1
MQERYGIQHLQANLDSTATKAHLSCLLVLSRMHEAQASRKASSMRSQSAEAYQNELVITTSLGELIQQYKCAAMGENRVWEPHNTRSGSAHATSKTICDFLLLEGSYISNSYKDLCIVLPFR